MEYLIKNERELNNFQTIDIYHTKYKILEKSNNHLWNATEENPIGIAKSRKDDYTVSDILLDKEEQEEIIEEK